MHGADQSNGISPATTVKVTLDQVVRGFVVVSLFCIGWLWNGQEAIRADQKQIWDRLEANLIERQALATRMEVIDKVGALKLEYINQKLADLERPLRELTADQRAAKRSHP